MKIGWDRNAAMDVACGGLVWCGVSQAPVGCRVLLTSKDPWAAWDFPHGTARSSGIVSDFGCCESTHRVS